MSIRWSMDLVIHQAPARDCQAVELLMAQFGERLEGEIATVLLREFPEAHLEFNQKEEA